MWRRLSLIFVGLCCGIAGYLLGRGATLSNESLVLSIAKAQVEALTGPFICILGEHGNVRRYLNLAGIQTDKFSDIGTLDDRNMLVVFNGRELTAVEFTTLRHSFSEEKCSRINS
jgi:hypothetical protein